VYEEGTLRGSFGAYSVGDRLRVAVENGVVKYYRNASLLYTSSQAVQYPLLVDTALYTSGTALTDISVSGSFGHAPVAPPVFNPAGGTYTAPQTVSGSSATPFAEIRYTTDGTEPVPSSTLYTEPISIGTTTTLKAKAWRTGLTPSTITSATYQMNFGTLSAPVMAPGSGVYEAPQGSRSPPPRCDDPVHDRPSGTDQALLSTRVRSASRSRPPSRRRPTTPTSRQAPRARPPTPSSR
jgi:hypothetical protein